MVNIENGTIYPLLHKMIVLPRQARDKHRENSKKETVLTIDRVGSAGEKLFHKTGILADKIYNYVVSRRRCMLKNETWRTTNSGEQSTLCVSLCASLCLPSRCKNTFD